MVWKSYITEDMSASAARWDQTETQTFLLKCLAGFLSLSDTGPPLSGLDHIAQCGILSASRGLVTKPRSLGCN